MRGVGEMLISGRGETNIDMQMVATRRSQIASAIPIGRSVGVHDFLLRKRVRRFERPTFTLKM